MIRISTLTATTALWLVSTFALTTSPALGQTSRPVSPWQIELARIKVGECKNRAEKFLEAKGFEVTKHSSQLADDTEANAEAASEDFFVLVDCIRSQRDKTRILVVVVGRNARAAEQVEQLRKDVARAVVN